ncbi:hypothetical protein J4457_00965, partial [Candidatus Woesearchaeota archaeon]|nr:hypothetical protein [Candidatus Woesearchaeota archaeon]
GGSIFGEESIAELGAEELNLQINPVLSEIDINDVSDAKEKEFKKDYFEEDIEATQDKTYEEDIDKKHREVVKNYYKEIAQS